MSYRDFLNAILGFISSTSLTDAEFLTAQGTANIFDQTSYDDLARILETREDVSTMQDRLTHFYSAKGVKVKSVVTGSTNIFIGAVL